MAPDDNLSEPEAQIVRMLHRAAQTERAPASLRAAIDDLRDQVTGSKRPARPRVLSRPAHVFAAGCSLLVAVAVVLVLTLGGGPATAPSIAQAATLATRGPVAVAPAPDPQAPSTLLSASVGGLHFPNWERGRGWRGSGERTDQLGDRAVKTVYYVKGGHQIAYSIVSSPVLPGFETHGQRYATIWQHGRTVVVWEERGHTCILSAAGTSAARLWRLAATTLA